MKETVYPSAVQGRIVAPASKSYAQRALAAALLVPDSDNPAGWSELRNMGLCNDTSAALDVIRHLGAEVRYGDNKGTYYVEGGFLKHKPQELNIGESGLATRLFTPIAAQSPVPVTITGHGSILKRPVASSMAEPLRDLGAAISFTGGGFLPLTVSGPLCGGLVEVDGSLSSQFITGLLMALPLSAKDTRIVVRSPKSVPYLAMTLEVLRAFGIRVSHAADYTEFRVPGRQRYQAALYNIEGDWSGASCLLVAGAVAGAPGGQGVTVDNLNPRSLQADRAIVEALERAGASVDSRGHLLTVRRRAEGLRGFEFDATDCPDLFPALAALATFCRGMTVLRGTTRLTHKESDRAATIAAEFAKLGVEIDLSQRDTMIVRGLSDPNGLLTVRDALLDSHNDHRIAMATAVAALRANRPVVIDGATAVDKSYPNFWNDLKNICLK
ncbi:3-phosphoshikimate 1-carboxyvinyltransferase [uncultured Rikenella sp.]|uniref:3-phosphoshikimate 1-carboxyvinyltransferase n=1 Tax=uncultured Rikenella sp. TaxID=368003 RepID=UPI0026219F4B|nr:3-phosphoshikimate 1-carboxyvinyltransferase [uncultured Rikenella sp.]